MNQQGVGMNTTARPTCNHPDVMASAVALVMDDVKKWADSMDVKHTVEETESDSEFRALITIAFIESENAYEAGKYLETMYGWPVDFDLTNILNMAYRAIPMILPTHVSAWVMASKVRFPAKKGNGVKVKIGDAEFSAVITDVLDREARGWCEVINSTPKGKIIAINAEEVIKVTSAGNGIAPAPNNTPTGGTPVAARTHGDKLLKELRVA